MSELQHTYKVQTEQKIRREKGIKITHLSMASGCQHSQKNTLFAGKLGFSGEKPTFSGKTHFAVEKLNLSNNPNFSGR